MGYDMYFVDEKAEDRYFRINIWGMGSFRDAMYDTGMLYDADHEPFPSGTPDKIMNIAWELMDGGKGPDDATDDEIEQARVCQQRCSDILSSHPAGGAGIPLFKLCSNDGWVLTPDELTAALSAYNALDPVDREKAIAPHISDDVREYWDQWLVYLSRGVVHGGITVW